MAQNSEDVASPLPQPEGAPALNFARALFQALEAREIRCRVLHGCKECLDRASTEIELSIHPGDRGKWRRVIHELAVRKYLPLQEVRCDVRTWRYRFVSFQRNSINRSTVKISYGDRNDNAFPLSRDGSRVGGENICASMCHAGLLVFRTLSGRLCGARFRLRRAGIFLVILGPDGVGKSTLIKDLTEATRPMFDGYRVFHWRPMLLWKRKQSAAVTDPHGRPPHSAMWSVARILSHVLDYWVGYSCKIRPMLAKSSLVVFDRYFYDLLVDPLRYRYAGPKWLIRALSPLLPKPDVVLVLDAPDETILSRKREISQQEIRRQRQDYRELASKIRNSKLIRTDEEIATVVSRVSQAITGLLVQRFSKQHFCWDLWPTPGTNE